MSSEELSDEECSEDSVTVDEVLEMVLEGDALHYLCRKEDGSEEVYDRSDLIDGGDIQQKVLTFERRHPPPLLRRGTLSVCTGPVRMRGVRRGRIDGFKRQTHLRTPAT